MLICYSYGDTRWYFESPRSEVISRSNILLFHSVNRNSGGKYFCYGHYPDNNLRNYFLAEAVMHVTGKVVLGHFSFM